MSPVSGSPPRPSMVPSPTTPESIGLTTVMRCLHDELPVPLPPHLPEPATWSNSRGLCDANRWSRCRATASRRPSASAPPTRTRSCRRRSRGARPGPTGQAVIAAWIAAVSSVSSLGAPAVTVLVASTVAHAAGIVGSAPMASHGGGDDRRQRRARAACAALPAPASRARAATGAAPGPRRPARSQRRCRPRRLFRAWAPPCPPLLPAVPPGPGRNAGVGRLRAIATRARPARAGRTSTQKRARQSTGNDSKGVPGAGTRGSRRGRGLRRENPRCRDHLPCERTSPNASKLIFSGTASRRGRNISVTPANSEMAHLHYGRIILDAERAAGGVRDRGARDGAAVHARRLLGDRRRDALRHRAARRDLRPARQRRRGGDDRRGRSGRMRRRGERRLPAAGHPLRRPGGGPEAEVPRRRRIDQPRSQHRHRRQRAGRADPARLHALAAGQLDQLASPRAHEDARGALRLLRHAAARVRHPAGLRQPGRARVRQPSCTTATRC